MNRMLPVLALAVAGCAASHASPTRSVEPRALLESWAQAFCTGLARCGLDDLTVADCERMPLVSERAHMGFPWDAEELLRAGVLTVEADEAHACFDALASSCAVGGHDRVPCMGILRPGPHATPIGAACSSDLECGAGAYCHGATGPSPTDACAPRATCRIAPLAGERCDDQVCAQDASGHVTLCVGSDDRRCARAVVRTSGLGEPCGVMIGDGILEGWICEGELGCSEREPDVPRCRPRGQRGERCVAHGDCARSLRCLDQACAEPIDPIGRACRPTASTYGDCGWIAGLACDPATLRCREADGRIGSRCNRLSLCVEGRCEDGLCVRGLAAEGQPCLDGRECASGCCQRVAGDGRCG